MATEIERKFLVTGDSWRGLGKGVHYRQGYLPTDDSCVVRVRTMGTQAVLTIKGRNIGITRQEYEYPIPFSDAERLLDGFCRRPLIEKMRYSIHFGDSIWEVDEFGGENSGLIVAEVELKDEREQISLPGWIGPEVSDDPRYFNVNLIARPYCNWGNSADNPTTSDD